MKYSDNNFKDKFLLIVMHFKLIYCYIYVDIVYVCVHINNQEFVAWWKIV